MTISQEKTIKEINATVIKSGKKTLSFKMEINDRGGFWVDVYSTGFRCATLLGMYDQEEYIREFNYINFKEFNFRSSKKNVATIENIIKKLLNYYK